MLQSIKQAEMTPMLTRIYDTEGGSDALDTLMKYMYRATITGILPPNADAGFCRYKGMAAAPASSSKTQSPQATGFSQIQGRGPTEGGGQAMSVLLSWHEKVVEVAGQGSIVRVMSDRRTV